MSGGFPHSEIHGSKPIPGSPWLNAGYHVLHRLLLPRHPPNALFALDLIQKEQGRPSGQPIFLAPDLADLASRLQKQTTCQKLYTYPCVQRTCLATQSPHTVSVLDLEQYRSWARSPADPYSDQPNDTDVSLSKRCQFIPCRTIRGIRKCR